MQKYLVAVLLLAGFGNDCSASEKRLKDNPGPSTLPSVKVEQVFNWIDKSNDQGKALPKALLKIKERVMKGKAPRASKVKSVPAFQKAKQNEVGSRTHDSGCTKKVLLRCKDFKPNGVVITKPGYYCLSESVLYEAPIDHTPAITIMSDNVTLDLSGHALQQCSNSFNAFDNITGIVVASGYNNITIKNGHVGNFSNHGILVQSDNTGSTTDHENIVIEMISVADCGKITTAPDIAPFNTRSGIAVYGTTNCLIEECQTSGITSLIDTEAISTFFTDTLIIKNCFSHDNKADPDTGITEGIEINFFTNALIADCVCINNQGSQAVGINPVFGESVVIVNCRANENQAYFPTVNSAFVSGILPIFVESAVITHCQANHNTSQSDVPGQSSRQFASGIELALGNGIISECEANFNTATSNTGLAAGSAAGFDINTTDSCLVSNCTAAGNTNFSTDQTLGGSNGSYGFICDSAPNTVFENCIANANNALEGGTPFQVVGYYAGIFPDGGTFTNIVYRNCISLNHSSNFAGTTVAGFVLGESPPTNIVVNPDQIIFDSCVAEGNSNSANPGNGAGISFENGTTNSSATNCILKGNGVGLLVRGNNTVSNLFENNELSGNLVYGIQDTTGNLNSYAKNYAYNPAALANYIGLPSFTPIRDWQIGNAPASVDNNGILDPLDNYNVFN